jgi:hypothetical protein
MRRRYDSWKLSSHFAHKISAFSAQCRDGKPILKICFRYLGWCQRDGAQIVFRQQNKKDAGEYPETSEVDGARGCPVLCLLAPGPLKGEAESQYCMYSTQ